MTNIVTGFGLPFYSYLLVQRARDDAASDPVRLITNYATEWCERYQRKLYKHYDPVAVVSAQSRLPFFWDSKDFLRTFRKDQRRVFHEGRSFDIVCGYSIPISGPAGDIGVFSVAASRESHLLGAINGAGGAIYVSALQAHDRTTRLLGNSTAEECDIALSAREIECLKWTADGMTTNTIAEIVSLSPATVNYHLNKTIRKLRASNRLHAAVKAIRAGLI